MKVKILYFDNHLIAAEKPFGIPTQPVQGFSENLENSVKEWVREEFKKTGNIFLHAVHRLDRVAGGIVIFAKTDKALSKMNELVRKHMVKKTYFAILDNTPKNPHGVLKHFLKHDSRFSKVSNHPKDNYKEAILEYEVMSIGLSKNCMVKINLTTGRYHQIRSQFGHIGCPVAGDTKYGSKINLGKNEIALFHQSVTFIHPIKKEEINISAELPKYKVWDI